MATELRYGGRYHIQNLYGPKGYLDTYGGFKQDGYQGWSVGVASSGNRGPGTGSWRILSARDAKKNDEKVCCGDLIVLQNQYTGGASTYLFTHGWAPSGSGNSVLSVYASGTRDANSGSSYWKLRVANKNDGDVVTTDDIVSIENQYILSDAKHNGPTYLDSYGSFIWTDAKKGSGDPKKEGILFGVYTNMKQDRAGQGTGHWQFSYSPLIKWEAELLDLEYDQEALQKLRNSPNKRIGYFSTMTVNNSSPATAHPAQNITHQETNTFEFSLQETLSATVTVSGKVSVPGLVEVGSSIAMSMSLQAGQKWTSSTVVTYVVSGTVDVPPNSSVNISLQLDTVDNATVPLTYTFRVKGKDLLTGKYLEPDRLKVELRDSGYNGIIVNEDSDASDGLDFVDVQMGGVVKGKVGTHAALAIVNTAPSGSTISG